MNLATDGATTYSLYGAAPASGLGNIVVGSLAGGAAAWWLNFPASAKAATYISTITLAISSAPPA